MLIGKKLSCGGLLLVILKRQLLNKLIRGLTDLSEILEHV